jgi:hypothetical protein
MVMGLSKPVTGLYYDPSHKIPDRLVLQRVNIPEKLPEQDDRAPSYERYTS